MTAAPAVETTNEILSPPTDEETLSLYAPAEDDPVAEINDHILNHPLTLKLTADPKFRASRPHLKIPPSLRQTNFTGGTLMGEHKIAVPPLTFTSGSADPDDLPVMISIQHLGIALCGHPGIIHGGLLATLLDEGLARCCFPALPNKVGVTASLKIDYKKPCMAGQYVVLKSETTKVDGRKAWVKGRLETLPADGSDGVVLVEAEALFIEPKQAAVSLTFSLISRGSLVRIWTWWELDGDAIVILRTVNLSVPSITLLWLRWKRFLPKSHLDPPFFPSTRKYNHGKEQS